MCRSRRIGLINTMVFTHIPSNVFLILIPFMPSQWSAIAVLLCRSCLSQMDVPISADWTDQHDGFHAHPLQRFPDPDPVHAKPVVGDRGAALPIVRVPDGCADLGGLD